MVVYIAGRMRNLKDFGKKKFMAAEKRLQKAGYVVLNPARLPDGMPYERYMPICLSLVEQADAVYMLDNWESSEGAQLEYNYAEFQQKIILFE